MQENMMPVETVRDAIQESAARELQAIAIQSTGTSQEEAMGAMLPHSIAPLPQKEEDKVKALTVSFLPFSHPVLVRMRAIHADKADYKGTKGIDPSLSLSPSATLPKKESKVKARKDKDYPTDLDYYAFSMSHARRYAYRALRTMGKVIKEAKGKRIDDTLIDDIAQSAFLLYLASREPGRTEYDTIGACRRAMQDYRAQLAKERKAIEYVPVKAIEYAFEDAMSLSASYADGERLQRALFLLTTGMRRADIADALNIHRDTLHTMLREFKVKMQEKYQDKARNIRTNTLYGPHAVYTPIATYRPCLDTSRMGYGVDSGKRVKEPIPVNDMEPVPYLDRGDDATGLTYHDMDLSVWQGSHI